MTLTGRSRLGSWWFRSHLPFPFQTLAGVGVGCESVLEEDEAGLERRFLKYHDHGGSALRAAEH